MERNRSRWVISGILLLAALTLFSGTALIVWLFWAPSGFSAAGPMRGFFRGPGGSIPQFAEGEFESNGEQIYRTGTSQAGPPITAEVPGMHAMPQGMMACVVCHGENGEGGEVRMMMSTFEAPNIQYEHLIEEEHEEDHPPYTDETIRRAITEGVNPAGEPLDWPMPRWDMTDEQLDDLISYLKTLP